MRHAEIQRKTTETDVSIKWTLDGAGKRKIDSGIGFFDHMMELFACHGGFDIELVCKGDVRVDGHHSIEDIGIVLGKALAQMLGDKRGIKRYASATVPMDESLANVTVDISGRAFLAFNADFEGKIGDFDTELIEEFFRAFSNAAGLTLHINLLYGGNNHHRAEAVFKAFARAVAEACLICGDAVPSSKGMLE